MDTSPPAASWASQTSRGRLHHEKEDPHRNPWQRDRDRILHSTAFRRLEYKTQVFIYHEGDHYRTRLTHTLEVAQIARSLARRLALNEDLSEAIALAHDLGHPPFGHAGEQALDTGMRSFGGFNHNIHSVRVLTTLERRYAAFDGLNPSWETLEGIVKHNGPPKDEATRQALRALAQSYHIDLTTWPSLEAQVSALADDIAYNAHDVDDGLRSRLLDFAELKDDPLAHEAAKAARHACAQHRHGEEPQRLQHETVRRLVNLMVNDLTSHTQQRLQRRNPRSAEEIRQNEQLAAFSPAMKERIDGLHDFLKNRVYRSATLCRETAHAKDIIRRLFRHFLHTPADLPEGWRPQAGTPEKQRARSSCDYIAGMTDRFASKTANRLHPRTDDASWTTIPT